MSEKAERLIRAQLRPAISDLTDVELFSALSRKTRLRTLSRAEAERIAAQFVAHLQGNLYRRVALERRHYQLARDWIGRFTTPLRTLDGLHLAVAATEGLELVTGDEALARSAESLGVRVHHLT